MVISTMHLREVESIEDIKEKVQIVNLLDVYGKELKYNYEKIRKRADELILKNFGIADSVHLAFAEYSADCFIICDDKLLKRSKRAGMKVKVLNPIEFCIIEELR